MKIIKNIILTIGIILIAICFIVNIRYIVNIIDSWQETATITNYTILHIAISILIAIAIEIICFILNKLINRDKKINRKKIFIIAILISFIGYIGFEAYWINFRESYPIADSLRVYNAAVDMYKGNKINDLFYFEYNPQNLTLSYCFSIIFKIVNSSNQIIIKYLNVVSNCLSICGLYLITKMLSKKYKINKILFFFLAFSYIPIILLVNLLYGDLVSLTFAIFSIYFNMKYAENKKIRNIVLSCITILIAIALRMNNLIFLIANSIYLCFNLIDEIKLIISNKKSKKIILRYIAVLLMFVIISLAGTKIFKMNLQNKYEVDPDKELPSTRYIAMGMQEGFRANGWYNDTGDLGWKRRVESEEYVSMIKERIKYFLSDIKYTFRFYEGKIISMWADPLQESIWQNLSFNFNFDEEKINTGEIDIDQVNKKDELIISKRNCAQIFLKAWLIIVFGNILIFLIINRKDISNEAMLLLLCFIGGFLFHILWEGKSRYVIPYIVILIPLASVQIDFSKKKIKKICQGNSISVKKQKSN